MKTKAWLLFMLLTAASVLLHGQAPANGFLRITSRPSGAEVTVNGNSVGTTPGTFRVVPGNQRVVLRWDGPDYEFECTVGPGETVERAIDLQASPTDASLFGKKLQVCETLTPREKQIAALLKQSIDPVEPLPPQEFYKRLSDIGGEKPMVTLNRVKTGLTKAGLAEECLGPRTSEGGSKAESILLGYRRDLTIEGIRYAIRELARRSGGNVDALGKVYLAKIGKWANQKPEGFTIAGDIDFTFMASEQETARALVEIFDTFIRERTGMTMGQFDSVATAQGEGAHLVYVGPQGEKYGDDEMAKAGRKPEDIAKSGVEAIDFNNPDSAGTSEHAVSGKQAMQDVLLAQVLRDSGQGARNPQVDEAFERAWEQKRNRSVEPFLSMELARHLEADIVSQADVFTAFDILKKGSKYFRRSNDIFTNDFKDQPSDAQWSRFVFEIDELAAGRWPFEPPPGTPTETGPDGKQKYKAATPEFIAHYANDNFLNTHPDLGKFWQVITKSDGTVELVADPEGVRRFLRGCQKGIWDNVSRGFDKRIEFITRLNEEPNEARRKAMVEETGKQLEELLEMYKAGLGAMEEEHSKIPAEVATKARTLLDLIDALPRGSTFKLPPEDLQRLRQALEACEGKPESQMLVLVGYLDKADKWAVEEYDRRTAAGETATKVLNRTSLYLDAVNSIMDSLTPEALETMRSSGIIVYEYKTGKVDKYGNEEKARVKLLQCETLANFNERLNKSILGKIGNNTAFKAFNLQQEASAYYDAVASANTPGEAFQNLATEIFRRRVPGGDAVEAAYMGQWGVACLKVVYVVFPTLAIPEAIYGLARTVWDFTVDYWWSSSLELFVDELYAGAVFGHEDPVTGQTTERWYLESITQGGQTSTREGLQRGNCPLLSDEAFDFYLRKNLAATDPFLTLMEELKNHPAATERYKEKLDQDEKARWSLVKKDFVKRMIDRLEKRKAAEDAGATGDADKIFGELLAATTELEIADQVLKSMNAEWDSNNLKAFWEKVVMAKRWVRSQAMLETERTKAIEVVTKYRDGYRAILEVRGKVEEEIHGWKSDVGLPPGVDRVAGLRLVTGVNFLNGHLEDDAKVARRWTSLPGSLHAAVESELLEIKRRVIPGAELDTQQDKEYLARISFNDVWIKALQETSSRNPLWAARFSEATAQRQAVRDKLLADYEALYGGATRTLVVKVRQRVTVKDERGGPDRFEILPLPTATVDLQRDGKAVQLDRKNESDFVASKLDGGQYSLRVTAEGFKTPSGEPEFQQAVDVPSDAKAVIRPIEVLFLPAGESGGLSVVIDCRDEAGKPLGGDPVTIKDNERLSLTARVTEKGDSGELRYNWAMGDKVLGSPKSKTIHFSGEDLAGTTVTVTLLATDARDRDGQAEVHVKVLSGKALAVRFGSHREEIKSNEGETITVEAPDEPGLKYHWKVTEEGAAHPTVDQDGERSWFIDGKYYAGKKLTIAATVTNAEGNSGEGRTTLSVKGEEAEARLAVRIDPSEATIAEDGSVDLTASAGGYPDSGEILYSWDGGATFGSRASARCDGKASPGKTQLSVSVIAKDEKGRTGEATATVFLKKAVKTPAEEEKEKAEKEKVEQAEKEKAAKEAAEKEKAEQEKAAAEKAEKEKAAKEAEEKAKAALAQKEKAEKEKAEKEKAELAQKEKAEKERFDRENAEKAKKETEKTGQPTVPATLEKVKLSGAAPQVYFGSQATLSVLADQPQGIATVSGYCADEGHSGPFPTETPRPGLAVTLTYTGPTGPVSLQATTDKDGRFAFANIPGGVKYTVSADGQTRTQTMTSPASAQSVGFSFGEGLVIKNVPTVSTGKSDNVVIPPPPPSSEPVKKPAPAATDASKAGKRRYVWQSTPSLTFDPPTSTDGTTRVTYDRTGQVKIWCEIQEEVGGGVFRTAGESDQVVVEVIPPKLTLTAAPPNPLAGQEVKVTVSEEPKVAEGLIDFRWQIAGSALSPGPLQDQRAYTFKPKDRSPVTVTVMALGKGGRDDLGRQTITITAGLYTVTVSGPKVAGPKPQVWKEGVGLVDVGNEIAVDQIVEFTVTVQPAPEKEPLTYSWRVSAGTATISNPTSRDARVTAGAEGTCELTVAVKDGNGVEVGTATGRFNATVSREVIRKSQERARQEDENNKKKLRAKQLADEGRACEGRGDLNGAIAKYEESVRTWPDNQISDRIQQLKVKLANQQEESRKKEMARQLAVEGQACESRGDLACAIAKYEEAVRIWPDAQLAGRIQQLKAKLAAQQEEARKREQARQLAGEGQACESRGDLACAIAKYEEAIRTWPDGQLAGRIQQLKAKLAAQQEEARKKEQARQLYGQGKACEDRGDLKRAIAKYEEALRVWPDEQLAARIQQLKAKQLAQEQEDQKKLRAQQLAEEGKACEDRGDLGCAIAKYEEANRTAPDEQLSARIQQIRGKLAQAEEESRKKQQAKQAYGEGQACESRGDLKCAIAKYEEALRIWPDDQLAARVQQLKARLAQAEAENQRKQQAGKLYAEGQACESRGDLRCAIARYEEAQRIWPDDQLAARVQQLKAKLAQAEAENQRRQQAGKLYAEGQACEGRGDLNCAIARYEDALRIWPDDQLAARIQQLKARLAQAEAENRRKQQAGQLFNDGRACEGRGDLNCAIAKYQEALCIWPDDQLAARVQQLKARLAQSQAESQRKQQAKQLYDQGQACESRGDLNCAIGNYEEALRLWPSEQLAARVKQLKARLGQSQAQNQKMQQAKQLYDQGQACESRGDLQGAIRNYEEAVRIVPNEQLSARIQELRAMKRTAKADQIQTLLNEGDQLASQGDYKGAIGKFSEVIAMDGNNVRAYASRGGARLSKGNCAEAERDFATAISLDPGNSDYYNDRGVARDHCGNKEGAANDFRKALELDPNNETARSNLGKVNPTPEPEIRPTGVDISGAWNSAGAGNPVIHVTGDGNTYTGTDNGSVVWKFTRLSDHTFRGDYRNGDGTWSSGYFAVQGESLYIGNKPFQEGSPVQGAFEWAWR